MSNAVEKRVSLLRSTKKQSTKQKGFLSRSLRVRPSGVKHEELKALPSVAIIPVSQLCSSRRGERDEPQLWSGRGERDHASGLPTRPSS